jgi:hypothetical protein
MTWTLLLSEYRFYFRKRLQYLLFPLMIVLGLMVSQFARFSFPGVYLNSPWVITYVFGLLTISNVFIITLVAAQVLTRESDTLFDRILYATPLQKKHFLPGRFLTVFSISIIYSVLLNTGYMFGHLLRAQGGEDLAAFNILYYVYPFLCLTLPNAFFCTAIVTAAGWISRNKLVICIAGLFIYILYMVTGLFSNSPLFANASPVSAESAAIMSLADPFGIVSFFDQTKQWSPLLRNTRVIGLEGDFLLNRLLTITLALVTLLLGYRAYRFTQKEKRNKVTRTSEPVAPETTARPATIKILSPGRYNLAVLSSFIKLELRSVISGIPMKLVTILWIFFLSVEIYSEIDAGIRFPQRYASSALMIKNIANSFSFFMLPVLLFYSMEMIWRSRSTRIADMESASPVNPIAVLAAKWISLSLIPVLLIILACLMSLGLQLFLHYNHIEWHVYATLLYILIIPTLLYAGIIISIQALVKNKYAGFLLSAVFIFATSSFMSRATGYSHPLLRFANSYTGQYSEMNGYGAYLNAFGLKMIFWTAFTIPVALVAAQKWSAGNFRPRAITKLIMILCLAVAGVTGFHISRMSDVRTGTQMNHHAHQYEEKYKGYRTTVQPVIKSVKTQIDLYPNFNRYDIRGEYTMVNQHHQPIDSLLLYCHKDMTIKTMEINGAELTREDPVFGHYSYHLHKPLQPGDSIRMQFEIGYRWSAYNRHDPFNAIMGNGSFMRISRYYPRLGYQQSNELDDEAERKRRGMPPPAALKTPEQKDTSATADDFIRFEATISTDGKHTAIGTGELASRWKANGRNYFRYSSPAPIPFRFAVSSAVYACKSSAQDGIPIEVYYHPGHGENVEQLLENTRQALRYCRKNFGEYPFNAIRYAEVSSFTEGFAATAYPGVIYMTENMTFHSDLRKQRTRDVINELAGHELAHSWWGDTQVNPQDLEGAIMLTETLAMYTELMIYKEAHGVKAMKDVVEMHRFIYENSGLAFTDGPLYKVHHKNVALAYNKGLVTMYELYELIGEQKINLALRNFLSKHAYPKPQPASTDLVNAFLDVSDEKLHGKIRALFYD